jgi:hypothetical protein
MVAVAWGRASPEVAGVGADEPLTIDLDATLIIAHSDDKDGAGKTYKRTGLLPRSWRWARGVAGRQNAGANNAARGVRSPAQLPNYPGVCHDQRPTTRRRGLTYVAEIARTSTSRLHPGAQQTITIDGYRFTSPTRPMTIWPASIPATAATPASRTASAPARTPACGPCRVTPSTATPYGYSSSCLPKTS